MKNLVNVSWRLVSVVLLFIAASCGKESNDSSQNPVASFQFTADPDNYLSIQFENFSQRAESYSWNFGDGSAASTLESPLHVYEQAGTYAVTLTVTASNGKTNERTVEIELVDPSFQLKKLTGESSKTWKLLRDVTSGVYPLQVGPNDRSQIWYALGLGNEIGARPCALNDEWEFNIDGTFEYRTNGDIWGEGGVWSDQVVPVSGDCVTDDAGNFLNVNGTDISAWGSGTHDFTYNINSANLTVSGLGAFIGLAKAGSTAEYNVPQTSVNYKVISLVDAEVDSLILETSISGANGYWRFVLVHYDNPADEPAIPGAKAVPSFTYVADGSAVTFTNTSSGPGTITYAWDFGDGNTSTETDPVHTFATDGAYTVTLTATNESGDATSSQEIIISSQLLTAAILNGGSSKTWKLKPGVGSFKVGQGKDGGNYFGGAVDISADRPCLFNDEFIFSATSNTYTYDSKGDVWGEPYMGINNTCDVESAMSTDAAAWKSGSHTYAFTAATQVDPATIEVIGTGAFIALPKAYNGGEYSAAPPTAASVTYEVLSYVNDGTTETLKITINVGADTFWTFTLVH
jgi:hypothetical protein